MTQRVAIVTDSTACIPPELANRYQIEVVPVVFIFGEKSYLDGVDMSTAEFYEKLKQSRNLPTTSGSLPGSYLNAFQKVSKIANNILCITVPAGLSGMFNSAQLALKMARETLPDTRITVMDCSTAAAGQGLVVLEAAKAAKKK